MLTVPAESRTPGCGLRSRATSCPKTRSPSPELRSRLQLNSLLFRSRREPNKWVLLDFVHEPLALLFPSHPLPHGSKHTAQAPHRSRAPMGGLRSPEKGQQTLQPRLLPPAGRTCQSGKKCPKSRDKLERPRTFEQSPLHKKSARLRGCEHRGQGSPLDPLLVRP